MHLLIKKYRCVLLEGNDSSFAMKRMFKGIQTLIS